MPKTRVVFTCRECRQQVSQWAGRCPGCGAWGSIGEAESTARAGAATGAGSRSLVLPVGDGDRPIAVGKPDLDRVLGGGLMPGSVTLLAGEPGIGKSTLLLHVLGSLAAAGRRCLLVSGEESHGQVAARARRLGLDGDAIAFAPGRDLAHVLDLASGERPDVLAVDSIQTLRNTAATQMPGGVSQVRTCTDALVGLAKSLGVAVVMTGHVTKDGDLAGPRALEHAVDVVLSFEGDPRSGLRMLAGGKNRFGAEGEVAWFEMGAAGLQPIEPSSLLLSGDRAPGAATALARTGRRALAVEVQALVASGDGPSRRQATGIDPRRFQLVAAVLDRALGGALGRAELFGAASGGMRVDDPACDLAIAAALASAATGVAPPDGSAFVGEISLTGRVRPAPAIAARLAAARAAGIRTVFAPKGATPDRGVELVEVERLEQALVWAGSSSGAASVR